MSLKDRIARRRRRLRTLRENIRGRVRGLRAVNRDIKALKRKRDSLRNPSPERRLVRLEIKHLRKVRREIRRIRDRHKRKANIVARRLRHDRQVYKRRRVGRKIVNLPVHGLVWFDGKQVAAWIARDLHRARAAGAIFTVISGWRSPAYSQSLCYRMCGRAFCPGQCAGTASNHVGIEYPRGAIDALGHWSLYTTLRRIGSRLVGYRLPWDRPHFSGTGQ